jgi:hypothetical protein
VPLSFAKWLLTGFLRDTVHLLHVHPGVGEGLHGDTKWLVIAPLLNDATGAIRHVRIVPVDVCQPIFGLSRSERSQSASVSKDAVEAAVSSVPRLRTTGTCHRRTRATVSAPMELWAPAGYDALTAQTRVQSDNSTQHPSQKRALRVVSESLYGSVTAGAMDIVKVNLTADSMSKG